MGAISKSKIIVTFIQNPCTSCSICFHCGFVIARKICRIDFNFHSFRLSWFQNLCFGNSCQLNCRFFYSSFCIRSLYIKLYCVFSSSIPGIGNGYSGFSHTSCLYFYFFQFLFKSSIRKAIAKRITYFICIIPCLSCGGTFCGICISLSENTIFITCFVIFVSVINSF